MCVSLYAWFMYTMLYDIGPHDDDLMCPYKPNDLRNILNFFFFLNNKKKTKGFCGGFSV